ncbi:MAG: ABC transporter substrate-binding protein [Chloroflexi bacterium]|nr:ABC transporter substrate-binding protein [Chloroflexota bacterium]
MSDLGPQRRPRPRGRSARAWFVLPAVIALLAAACASPASSTAPGSSSSAPASSAGPAGSLAPSSSAPSSSVAAAGASGTGVSGSVTHLTVGLGYIPSVQFAQFYLAQQAGYYRAAGLDVTFQNKIDPDLVVLVGQGNLDAGIADGTSVIPAVSQGIPIRYIATIYGTFPNIVFAKASSGITTAGDLKGKRIGTPCKCGSSWIMLQALLQSAHLTTSDVQIVEYPDYSQEAAVYRGAVDAATGYTNNEPLQLESQGQKVVVLHVDQTLPLPGPGLISSTQTIATKGAALRAFVAATLRAMRDIEANPQKGFDAALAVVPQLKSQQALQMSILKATIATWQSPYTQAHGLGAIDQAGWQQSVSFMSGLPEHLVPHPVTVSQLVDPSLLPSG